MSWLQVTVVRGSKDSRSFSFWRPGVVFVAGVAVPVGVMLAADPASGQPDGPTLRDYEAAQAFLDRSVVVGPEFEGARVSGRDVDGAAGQAHVGSQRVAPHLELTGSVPMAERPSKVQSSDIVGDGFDIAERPIPQRSSHSMLSPSAGDSPAAGTSDNSLERSNSGANLGDGAEASEPAANFQKVADAIAAGAQTSGSVDDGVGFHAVLRSDGTTAFTVVSTEDGNGGHTVTVDDHATGVTETAVVGNPMREMMPAEPLTLAGVQTGLDVLGVVDPTGAADIANAAISVATGNVERAVWAVVAAVPVAGSFAPAVGALAKARKPPLEPGLVRPVPGKMGKVELRQPAANDLPGSPRSAVGSTAAGAAVVGVSVLTTGDVADRGVASESVVEPPVGLPVPPVTTVDVPGGVSSAPLPGPLAAPNTKVGRAPVHFPDTVDREPVAEPLVEPAGPYVQPADVDPFNPNTWPAAEPRPPEKPADARPDQDEPAPDQERSPALTPSPALAPLVPTPTLDPGQSDDQGVPEGQQIFGSPPVISNNSKIPGDDGSTPQGATPDETGEASPDPAKPDHSRRALLRGSARLLAAAAIVPERAIGLEEVIGLLTPDTNLPFPDVPAELPDPAGLLVQSLAELMNKRLPPETVQILAREVAPARLGDLLNSVMYAEVLRKEGDGAPVHYLPHPSPGGISLFLAGGLLEKAEEQLTELDLDRAIAEIDGALPKASSLRLSYDDVDERLAQRLLEKENSPLSLAARSLLEVHGQAAAASARILEQYALLLEAINRGGSPVAPHIGVGMFKMINEAASKSPAAPPAASGDASLLSGSGSLSLVEPQGVALSVGPSLPGSDESGGPELDEPAANFQPASVELHGMTDDTRSVFAPLADTTEADLRAAVAAEVVRTLNSFEQEILVAEALDQPASSAEDRTRKIAAAEVEAEKELAEYVDRVGVLTRSGAFSATNGILTGDAVDSLREDASAVIAAQRKLTWLRDQQDQRNQQDAPPRQ